jgi:hypothetical protein
MPAADLKQVLVERPAPGRTAALIVAGVLGLAVGGYMVASSGASAPDLQSKCQIFEAGSNVECPQ